MVFIIVIVIVIVWYCQFHFTSVAIVIFHSNEMREGLDQFPGKLLPSDYNQTNMARRTEGMWKEWC